MLQITRRDLTPRLVTSRRMGGAAMTQEKQFEELLHEFERVGVDPNTISAGLAVPRAYMMRALAALPDGAGPAAFLTQLRRLMTDGSGRQETDGGNGAPDEGA